MRSGTLIVMALVAAAAFGGGYLVGATPSEPVDSSKTPVVSDSPGGASDVSEVLVGVSDARTPQLVGEGSNPNSLRALIRSVPTDDLVRGEGTLTGQVVSDKNEPVEGVLIKATPNRDRTRGWAGFDSLSAEEQLLNRLKGALEGERWRRSHELTATTDAKGAFAIEGLTAVNHRVSAHAEGWQFHTVNPFNVKVGSRVEFKAKRVTSVTFDIVCTDGTVPSSATISFLGGSSNHGIGWSPTRKTHVVHAGTFLVKVVAGDHQELAGEQENVIIEEGRDSEVRIELKFKPIAIVKLEFPEGEMSPAALVYMPWSASTAPSADKLRARGKAAQDARRFGHSSEANTFIVRDIIAGRYALGIVRGHHFRAGREDSVVEGVEVIEMGQRVTHHTLRIPNLPSSRFVRIQVMGPDGKPLENPRFGAGYKSKAMSQSGGAIACDEIGRHRVVIPSMSIPTESGTTAWIQVRSRSWGQMRLPIERLAGQSLTVTFAETAEVVVTVSGIERLELEDSTVQVAIQTEGGSSSRAQCDDEGCVAFKGLQPGSATLHFSVSSGGRQRGLSIHSESIALRSGKNTARVSLPPLHEVRLTNAQGNVWVSRKERSAGKTFHRNATAVDGEATIRWMPSGTYIAQSNKKFAIFTLPGASTVELKERKQK